MTNLELGEFGERRWRDDFVSRWKYGRGNVLVSVTRGIGFTGSRCGNGRCLVVPGAFGGGDRALSGRCRRRGSHRRRGWRSRQRTRVLRPREGRGRCDVGCRPQGGGNRAVAADDRAVLAVGTTLDDRYGIELVITSGGRRRRGRGLRVLSAQPQRVEPRVRLLVLSASERLQGVVFRLW